MVVIPISIGELIDKITILKIKLEKIKNPEKLQWIKKEYDLLINEKNKITQRNIITDPLFKKLYQINSILWNIEDQIRILEKKKQFDNEFITLARQVYQTNDQRASIKNEINQEFNSDIKEIKEYVDY